MLYSVQQIKFEIYAYVKEFGADFTEWHIGIADDPVLALEGRHGVDLDTDLWLHKRALSFKACLTIYSHFTNMLGVKGGLPSHDCREQGRSVYVFKKVVIDPMSTLATAV